MVKITNARAMVCAVPLPWKLRNWFSTDNKLINDSRSAVERIYLQQFVINNRLVLMKLSHQHVLGIRFFKHRVVASSVVFERFR